MSNTFINCNNSQDCAEIVNRIRCKLGSYRWFRWYLTPYNFKNRNSHLLEWQAIQYNPVLYAVARDITEQKIAEERFSIAFKENLSPMTITNLASGKFIDVNNEFLRSSEFTRNEVIGKTAIELNIFTPDTRQLLLEQLKQHKSVKNYELKFKTKSGQVRTALFSSEIVNINNCKCLLVMSSDLTERHQMYQALLHSEQRFKDIAYSIGDWIFEVDENFVITYYSGSADNVLGYTAKKMIGRQLFDFIDPNYLKSFKEEITQIFLQQKPFKDLLSWLIAKNGSRFCFLTSAAPIFNDQKEFKGFRGINKDITALKNAEATVCQLQKKEALGTLAGSIAHDINTILTVIVGYGNILYWKIKDNKNLSLYVKKILQASEKAAAFTQNLLAFGREQPPIFKQIDLNQLINNFNELLLRLIDEKITVKLHLTHNQLKAYVDSSKIEQVLMNLFINAKDALPNGGMITISTKVCTLSQNFITKTDAPNPGKYALLRVRDNGSGIAKKIQDKILEPFFTTKENGTGLGLAIICNIIKQHNGYINFKSKVNAGSVFDIYLPIANNVLTQKKNIVPVELSGKGETILFIEDDKIIRKLYQDILEEFGYEIIVAKNGLDDIAKFTKHQKNIALVIMDLIIPKLNGKETATKIRAIKPATKILFLSGYPSAITKPSKLHNENIALLKKPITPITLLTKIREVLASD